MSLLDEGMQLPSLLHEVVDGAQMLHERLDDLVSLAMPQEAWMAAPDSLVQKLYEAFCILSEADLDTISGPYGDYLLGKVGKVFPALKKTVL